MKLKNLKAFNTFLLVYLIIIMVAALTWIIPGGQYERILDETTGRELVQPGSYHAVEKNPQGFGAIILAPVKGFTDTNATLIMGFVLIIGGIFSVLQKTEAIDSAIKWVAWSYRRYRIVQRLFIPLFMVLFSIAGATFGMSEEVIPFVMIFVPLALALGYDTVVGLAIPFIGAGAGFAGAFMNPFTIGIAQEIARLPLFSGIAYRLVCWLVITAACTLFIMYYARKVKKNPASSITFEQDQEARSKLHLETATQNLHLDKKHIAVLITFIMGIIVMIVGVLKYQWYIEQITGVFIVLGFATAVVGRLSIKEFTDAFVAGAKDLVGTVLIIALARGVLFVAQDGHIIDTMLNSLTNIVTRFHPVVSAQIMFFIQSAINFFVPSGSAKAALTMPIMVPLADLTGITRQVAVLAYQFGDGFSNMIVPTSPVTMTVLMCTQIPWEKWAKWIIKLQIILLIIGMLLLIPPIFFNWQ